VKALLAPCLQRMAACPQNLIAGLAGIVIGSALGFVLLAWSNHSTQVIILGTFKLERIAMRDSVGGIVFDTGRLRDPLSISETP
jgi:hypothetical protein